MGCRNLLGYSMTSMRATVNTTDIYRECKSFLDERKMVSLFEFTVNQFVASIILPVTMPKLKL
jgi:hypothetical protein